MYNYINTLKNEVNNMNNKEKTCCFTGHRIIPESEYNSLKLRLKDEIIKLIDRGIVYFGAGALSVLIHWQHSLCLN